MFPSNHRRKFVGRRHSRHKHREVEADESEDKEDGLKISRNGLD